MQRANARQHEIRPSRTATAFLRVLGDCDRVEGGRSDLAETILQTIGGVTNTC